MKKARSKNSHRRWRVERWRTPVASVLLIVMALSSGCFLDQEVEPYYGRAVVPRSQELRWSDGGLPQVFDPALAAAAPDTDAVRAMFEGLTEYDPKTLAPVPAVASRWESSKDQLEWTFHLRRDARWSNNEPVTAHDFVRSWRRTLQLGERAPHARLMKNIQGATPPQQSPTLIPAEEVPPTPSPANGKEETKKEERAEIPKPVVFGATALDDYTLRVRLQRPDPGFASLVAHPVFRPVHKFDGLFENSRSVAATGVRPLSNGAFQLSKVSAEGVVLERAKNYWDVGKVALQRVQFVALKDAESALAAYRAGEVDAITNANFEPLALKLLAPYKDFKRATFGAITYYSFNRARPPFDDVRVREALTIAIDRDRLSEDHLGGATEPAKKFLPSQVPEAAAAHHAQAPLIEKNIERARQLLASAGYPEGQNFPKVRLLVNRNAQQRQVAEAVAAMWRSALNVETELLLKDWAEYELAFRSGDYDVARRSYVMQSVDEFHSLSEMFEQEAAATTTTGGAQTEEAAQGAQPRPEAGKSAEGEVKKEGGEKISAEQGRPSLPIITESEALKELPAIPLYFASSYALVKPYVVGFDTNLLDAPSLKHVRIDTSWQQPNKQATVAWFDSK